MLVEVEGVGTDGMVVAVVAWMSMAFMAWNVDVDITVVAVSWHFGDLC